MHGGGRARRQSVPALVSLSCSARRASLLARRVPPPPVCCTTSSSPARRRPTRASLESLLESYYGMQDEDSAAADAADIDSGSFDVAGAASAAVASKGLPELLAYKASLASAGARLSSTASTMPGLYLRLPTLSHTRDVTCPTTPIH